MLNLIVGNIDYAGAAVLIAFFGAATVVGCVLISSKKTPEDYEIEKSKVEIDRLRAESTLVAYRRSND